MSPPESTFHSWAQADRTVSRASHRGKNVSHKGILLWGKIKVNTLTQRNITIARVPFIVIKARCYYWAIHHWLRCVMWEVSWESATRTVHRRSEEEKRFSRENGRLNRSFPQNYVVFSDIKVEFLDRSGTVLCRIFAHFAKKVLWSLVIAFLCIFFLLIRKFVLLTLLPPHTHLQCRRFNDFAAPAPSLCLIMSFKDRKL